VKFEGKIFKEFDGQVR